MVVAGKKVLVFGSGISGIGAVKLLEENGADVVLYDGNEKLTEADVRAKLQEGSKARIIIGAFPEELLNTLDLVILSPGVPTDLPIILKMKEKEIPVIGEVELAYTFGKGDVLAITGTNGKTTTAFLTAGILQEAGYRIGMIGPIESYDGRRRETVKNTTPESCEIHRLLSRMVENECDCCVMEVSSQGIALQRTADVFFDIGVFLNIEPDHIGKGEHATFSEYLHCKSRLMRQCGIGIVNQDDPNVDKILAGHTCEVENFSIRHPSDVMAEDEWYGMESGSLQSHFTVKREWRREEIVMQLPGQFNVYNALAAISVAGHFKVNREQIKAALAKQVVPGRCQNMSAGAGYVFLIDYAHNEMSLRNLLETLRKFEPERLIVIFGCGGNRSVLRRYQMGETAGRLADFTIITSDNPRWEDPERIMDQIEDGLRGAVCAGKKPSYIKIADRRAAVEYAVSMAEKRDIIVLAGKGHESYQEIKGIRYPLDDRKIVQEALDGGIREYHC